MTTIAKLAPQHGFLGDFLAYTSETMMAPVEFQLAAGLAAISGALGKGARFWLGDWRRASLWALLIADAGQNKSTPTRIVTRLLHDVLTPDAILPRRWTLEGLYGALKKCPDGFWDMGELSGFLGTSKRDYMSGVKGELCDLWDSPPIWGRTLAKSEDKVETPAVSAIATVRPTDFENAAGSEDFTSGLLSRFVLFPGTGGTEYRGLDGHENQRIGVGSAWEHLKELLREVARWRSGDHVVEWDEDAKALFHATDKEWIADAADEVVELSGWARRRGIQMAKLAVLHAMSIRRKPFIDPEDVAWARGIILASWEAVSSISMERVGIDRQVARYERILERGRSLAKESGGEADERLWMRLVWRLLPGKAKEFRDLLEMWEQAGEIKRSQDNTRSNGARYVRFRPRKPVNESVNKTPEVVNVRQRLSTPTPAMGG